MTTPDTTPSADELRADVERTRAELGATLDALARKLDVRSRVRRRAEETRASLTGDPRRVAVAAGALGLLAGTVVLVVWRRSR